MDLIALNPVTKYSSFEKLYLSFSEAICLHISWGVCRVLLRSIVSGDDNYYKYLMTREYLIFSPQVLKLIKYY